MKPISKKHYMLTVNMAAALLVLAAIFSDRYPEWRLALLGASTLATAACVYVYFRHRFDVLAGRASDDDQDDAPDEAKATPASDKDHA